MEYVICILAISVLALLFISFEDFCQKNKPLKDIVYQQNGIMFLIGYTMLFYFYIKLNLEKFTARDVSEEYRKTRFIAVDFETATSNKFACQIGIVVVKDGEIKESISRLIQPPGNVYDKNNTRVHHIKPEDTMQSPLFNEIWEEVGHYFSGTTIVAHNASFDSRVLNVNMEYYGIKPLGIDTGKNWIDTCALFGGKSLEDLCEAFKMSITGHHDALFDARCSALFYMNYLKGVAPDYSLITIKTKKNKLGYKKEQQISGDVLVKDLSNADPNNPFYDKKVVITGYFIQDRRDIASKLKLMGADVNTNISKKTNFVLIGSDPGPKKMEKLDKLICDGFSIRKIYQEDIDAIFAGELERYHV